MKPITSRPVGRWSEVLVVEMPRREARLGIERLQAGRNGLQYQRVWKHSVCFNLQDSYGR
jgi:hypothetical protein